ncbi:hypothetical protein KVH01_17740 [Pseudomonas sp. SWRI124]|nr:transaldolase family protein [Pseudomonas khavaziana]MBV4481747.1 hypothetical protein [Pseudomonas khavaziana]
MTSKLEQLKQFTTVVCDTGDLEAISRLRPVDATTNPSLLLKAAAIPEYAELLRSVVAQSKGDVGLACDHFAVAVGAGILKVIPGRISTEGEARQTLTEAQFRWASNEDAMATEKLAEGIRQFARDQEKLEKLLASA